MRPFAHPPIRSAVPLAALALLAALSVAGCGRNRPTSILAPSGVRPVALSPAGGLWGYLVFDPGHYEGLDLPPYPPARLDLYDGAGRHVDSLVTARDSRHFEFDRLAPGHYTLTVRSHAFALGSFGSYTVTDFAQDTGDLQLHTFGDSLTSEAFVIGTMAGFTPDMIPGFSTSMQSDVTGIWTYPGFFGATPVPAGTYRMKFVIDESSSPGHLIGWGGDSTQVLTAPITEAPLRYGTGAASDLKVTFPTAGVYNFTFDERRLTFSIAAATAPARVVRAVSRRIR